MSVSGFFDFLANHRDIVGLLTAFLSVVGFVLTCEMHAFISKSHSKLAKNLSNVYFWDSAKFLITFCFGVAALIDSSAVIWDMLYWLDPFILIMLIIALRRLYKTFKLIGKE